MPLTELVVSILFHSSYFPHMETSILSVKGCKNQPYARRYGLWTGRHLYHATPAVKQVLDVCSLIEGPPNLVAFYNKRCVLTNSNLDPYRTQTQGDTVIYLWDEQSKMSVLVYIRTNTFVRCESRYLRLNVACLAYFLKTKIHKTLSMILTSS